MDDECILDEARFFDPTTKEWGYEVVCEHPDHRKRPERCPDEREMFRWVSQRHIDGEATS